MKKLLIFCVLILLYACQNNNEMKTAEIILGEENLQPKNSDEEKTPDTPKAINPKEQSAVIGATIGSFSSNYVIRKEGDKKINLPEILINSTDAKKANEKISELQKNLEEGEIAQEFSFNISSFSVYQNNKILSVYIKYNLPWYEHSEGHMAYNFSLPGGKLLTDYELLKEYNINEDMAVEYMENAISRQYKSDEYYTQIENYLNSSNQFEGLAIIDLWDKNHNRVYIDEAGNLRFIAQIILPEGSGEYMYSLPLEKQIGDNTLFSPEYLRMANVLGIDPNSDEKFGFIIYLGYAYYDEPLKTVLSKLYAWQAEFLNYEDPNLLLMSRENEDGTIEIKGYEYYLIIPKWKNTTISLREMELKEGGVLGEIENYSLDKRAVRGNCVVCVNQSEIMPNALVKMRYRDKNVEFSPSISLKDGEMEEISVLWSGKDILDFEKFINEEFYSGNLFEAIIFYMGRG